MPNCTSRDVFKTLVTTCDFVSFQIGEGDKLINVVLLNGERLNVRVQVKLFHFNRSFLSF